MAKRNHRKTFRGVKRITFNDVPIEHCSDDAESYFDKAIIELKNGRVFGISSCHACTALSVEEEEL